MRIKIDKNGVTTEECVENGVVIRIKQGQITCDIVNVHLLRGKLRPIHTKVFPVDGGEDFCVDISTDPRLKEVLEAFAEYTDFPVVEFCRGDLHIEITI